jgi:hypothetical protein
LQQGAAARYQDDETGRPAQARSGEGLGHDAQPRGPLDSQKAGIPALDAYEAAVAPDPGER